MKKNLLLLALLSCVTLAQTSCTKKSTGTTAFTVCIASKPQTIDPALNTTADGGTYDVHLFEGLYKWSYEGTYPNGKVSLVPGLAKEAPKRTANDNGTVTYTYTLRDDAKWSNGEKLTANDVERSWKRAVSKAVAADYAYLFEAIVGGADAEGETDGHSLSVKATSETTLTVDLVTDVPYWNELTAFPAFAPVYKTADVEGNWASIENSANFICNGPMKIKEYNDSKIEMVPNEHYTGTSVVNATDITFAFSDDDSAMLNSYKSGSYAFIDSFPNDQIEQIKNQYTKEYFNVGQLGTYYVCWNINDSTLTGNEHLKNETDREKFRNAVSKLINRQYLIDIGAKGGQAPATGFVASGLLDADGQTDWTKKNGPNQDGSGYYDVSTANYATQAATAVEEIKSLGFNYDEKEKKFTDAPTLKYLTNNGSGHEAIAQYLQAELGKYGISVAIESQEWATFISTRKAGDYSVARNGWLCDYNDPISMLDMFITDSGNNDVQFGKGANATYNGYSVDVNGDGTIAEDEKNLTWARSFDKLISNIKVTTDTTKRYKMMHDAETMLMSTGCITPLYYYTDFFLKKENMDGFFSSPLGYKFFYGASLK